MKEEYIKHIHSLSEHDAKERIFVIAEIVREYKDSGASMLTSTWDLLNRIEDTLIETGLSTSISMPNPDKLEHVIISCDASIKKNPGGPAAVGYFIEYKDNPSQKYAAMCSATTNNQAEYDAIYMALTNFTDLINNPGCEIEIRSDSKLVIKQLNGQWDCRDEELKKKRNAIWRLAQALPVLVSFQWRPRNSTSALAEANFLAQDLLGVPRH